MSDQGPRIVVTTTVRIVVRASPTVSRVSIQDPPSPTAVTRLSSTIVSPSVMSVRSTRSSSTETLPSSTLSVQPSIIIDPYAPLSTFGLYTTFPTNDPTVPSPTDFSASPSPNALADSSASSSGKTIPQPVVNALIGVGVAIGAVFIFVFAYHKTRSARRKNSGGEDVELNSIFKEESLTAVSGEKDLNSQSSLYYPVVGSSAPVRLRTRVQQLRSDDNQGVVQPENGWTDFTSQSDASQGIYYPYMTHSQVPSHHHTVCNMDGAFYAFTSTGNSQTKLATVATSPNTSDASETGTFDHGLFYTDDGHGPFQGFWSSDGHFMYVDPLGNYIIANPQHEHSGDGAPSKPIEEPELVRDLPSVPPEQPYFLTSLTETSNVSGSGTDDSVEGPHIEKEDGLDLADVAIPEPVIELDKTLPSLPHMKNEIIPENPLKETRQSLLTSKKKLTFSASSTDLLSSLKYSRGGYNSSGNTESNYTLTDDENPFKSGKHHRRQGSMSALPPLPRSSSHSSDTIMFGNRPNITTSELKTDTVIKRITQEANKTSMTLKDLAIPKQTPRAISTVSSLGKMMDFYRVSYVSSSSGPTVPASTSAVALDKSKKECMAKSTSGNQELNTPMTVPPVGSSQNQKLMSALAKYVPARRDELELNVGDEILVHHIFEDGWAYGESVATGVLGMIPYNFLSSSASASIALKATDAKDVPQGPSKSSDTQNAEVPNSTLLRSPGPRASSLIQNPALLPKTNPRTSSE